MKCPKCGFNMTEASVGLIMECVFCGYSISAAKMMKDSMK